jgi:hypothetical protein
VEAQNLHAAAALGLQAGEEQRVSPVQVQLGPHPQLHGLVEGNFPAGPAHLSRTPLVHDVQVAEEHGQLFPEQADVGLHIPPSPSVAPGEEGWGPATPALRRHQERTAWPPPWPNGLPIPAFRQALAAATAPSGASILPAFLPVFLPSLLTTARPRRAPCPSVTLPCLLLPTSQARKAPHPLPEPSPCSQTQSPPPAMATLHRNLCPMAPRLPLLQPPLPHPAASSTPGCAVAQAERAQAGH